MIGFETLYKLDIFFQTTSADAEVT